MLFRSLLRYTDLIDMPGISDPSMSPEVWERMAHLADGIQTGRADAVLAASIFHYGEFTVQQAKQFMAERGIPVRL